MIPLNKQQEAAVYRPSNLLISACAGSGKTRVLTCRVIKGLEKLTSPKHRVIALTFTNRAADEIQSRLDQLTINHDQLWAGTIHAFALEWILDPMPLIVHALEGVLRCLADFSERLLKMNVKSTCRIL